jgi:hypothetical protein
MKEVLQKIESAIPEKIKLDLRKKLVTGSQITFEMSKHLKEMAENNYEIRNILFKNNQDALYFSGDILAKALSSFWIKGGEVEDHFIESAQMTSFYARFECLWN